MQRIYFNYLPFFEDDTEDVPLIEIACGGEDGKPLYVNTGFETPTRASQIIAQLEKTAGKGNFHHIIRYMDFDEDDEDEFDEDEEFYNEDEDEFEDDDDEFYEEDGG